MSSSDSVWTTWQMGKLERRSANRVQQRPGGDSDTRKSKNKRQSDQSVAHRRRREDEISLTLFNLAKEEAREKGFNQGHAEGLKKGYAEGEKAVRAEHAQQLQAEISAHVEPIKELVDTFRQAVDGVNEQVSYALVELALDIGQQLAGRALDVKPEHILDDVEDLLEANPTLGGAPTLYVSVDDLSLIETQLQETLNAAGWHLRADIALSRGDCRVETEQGEIDATRGDRWSRLLYAVGHEEH